MMHIQFPSLEEGSDVNLCEIKQCQVGDSIGITNLYCLFDKDYKYERVKYATFETKPTFKNLIFFLYSQDSVI